MKRNLWKRLLSFGLCAVMMLCAVPVTAAETRAVRLERLELPELETSAQRYAFFTLDDSGIPALKDGTYEQWIDRVDFAGAEYAQTLYTWMEENSDIATGTGALIDPTGAEQLESGEYVYLITTVSGTGRYSYTGNSATDDDNAFYAVYDDLCANEVEVFSYVGAAFGAFDRDHPEVFWLSGESQMLDLISYSYNALGDVYYTQYLYFLLKSEDFDIRSESHRDATALKAAISGLYDAGGTVDQILSGVDSRAGSYEKVKYFHDWLTYHNCYNSNISTAAPDAFECISALTGAEGVNAPVCEAYARALKILCDRAGIHCVLVDGMAKIGSSSIAHMWNYVAMNDGKWYAVDTTWDDPTVSGVSRPVSGYENEDYLLVGSNTKIGSMTFIESHPAANRVFTNGTSFTNGPMLSETAYQPSAATVPTLTGKSFSLSFESEILVNFYYTVSDSTDVTQQGMLVFYTDPGTADISKADDVYTDTVYTESTGYYTNTTAGIAAKEMGDSRYYCAYAKLNDGTYVYSPLYQYSPKKYATNMLSKASTSDKQKALCVAMLNYGAAAQNYFGYNTDDLMNAALTDAQQALVADYDESYFTGAVAADDAKVGIFVQTEKGFSSRSASVSFEGAFCINYYFTPNLPVKGDVKFYYWTPEAYASASQLTVANASGSITMEMQENGAYFAQVSGIAAKNLDETYYVAGIYVNSRDGICCTGVIAYSLSKYCMNNAKPGKDMQELAADTAMYGYYAKAFFAK